MDSNTPFIKGCLLGFYVTQYHLKIKRYNFIFYDISTAKSVLFSSIFVFKIVYELFYISFQKHTNCMAKALLLR
nr:MAG TPA: hypothetical protein [Caudoviricetes sp.]